MTRMKGINNLKIRRAAIRNGCKLKKKSLSLQNRNRGKESPFPVQYLLTLKIVMNR